MAAGMSGGATPYSGSVLYAIVRNLDGQVYRTDTQVFETYNAANIGSYAITMTEQGSSGFFNFQFPVAITTASAYDVVGYKRGGGSPAEGDKAALGGTVAWNGTEIVSAISDLSDDARSDLTERAACSYVASQSRRIVQSGGPQLFTR